MCKPAGHAALNVKLTSSAVETGYRRDRRHGGSEVGGGGGESGFLHERDGDFSRKIRIKFLKKTTEGMAQT